MVELSEHVGRSGVRGGGRAVARLCPSNSLNGHHVHLLCLSNIGMRAKSEMWSSYLLSLISSLVVGTSSNDLAHVQLCALTVRSLSMYLPHSFSNWLRYTVAYFVHDLKPDDIHWTVSDYGWTRA
jgi:hypothetical protein